jgi:hypothetical protein
MTFWTWLVVIGVVADIVFAIHVYWDELVAWRRGIIRPPDRPSKRWFVCELLAIGLVVAGISGELVIEAKIGTLETSIRKANDDLRLALEQKVEDADTKASAADQTAADNERKAASLQKQAEDEHTARVKIEAAVVFRQLTPQQKGKLGDDLARFKGRVGISFWYQANDAEAQLFGDDLAEALRAKGAIVQPPGNFLSMKATGKYGDPIVGADTGVTVQSTKVGDAPEFALALIKELNDMGFDAKRQTDPPFDKDTTSPLVWVNVDARPKGPQGEYKLQAISTKMAKR